jgi:muramoyltetrapeptide carboxypeptidase
VNPGTWIDPEADFDGLRRRCAAEGWQLEVPSVVRRQWRYFSGTDGERRQQLEAAWRDPTVDAVFYVGAGWGSARVLESGFRIPPRPLWTVGFSDCSALLLAQWAAGFGGAVHGSTGGPQEQWQRTADLLAGRPVAPLQGRGLRPGRVRGPLVVSNLTVATHLIGTPWLPQLAGAILVLEDVGEAPYRVDRMITQWRTSGLLRGIAGVAVGRFSWTGTPEPGDFSMAEILEERLGDLGVPLVSELPVGHGLPNQALPLGAEAALDGASGTLTLAGQAATATRGSSSPLA